MKKNLLLLLSLTLVLSSPVQAQKRVIEKLKKYSSAKIYMPNHLILGAKDLTMINDTLLQFRSRSTDGSVNMKQLSTSGVRYLKIKTGTYAGVGFAAGAGVGLLSSLYGILSVKEDPTLDDSETNWTPFVLGFTGGGALIGTIVGLCIPKWKTFFIPDQRTPYSFNICPAVNPIYKGAGVRITF